MTTKLSLLLLCLLAVQIFFPWGWAPIPADATTTSSNNSVTPQSPGGALEPAPQQQQPPVQGQPQGPALTPIPPGPGQCLKPFTENNVGYQIQVPCVWTDAAYLGPGQGIVHWVAPDGTAVVTVTIYRAGGYNLDAFVNQKINLVTATGMQQVASYTLDFGGNVQGHQLGFAGGYSTILIPYNGLVYDIGLYGDEQWYDTLLKISSTFRVFQPMSPGASQDLAILAFKTGLEGMNDSFDLASDFLSGSGTFDDD